MPSQNPELSLPFVPQLPAIGIPPGVLVQYFPRAAPGAFGLQQLPDHGARDFPGAIGVAQVLAMGIGDQLVTKPGVEIIAWHSLKPTFRLVATTAADVAHKTFIRDLRELLRPGVHVVASATDPETY